MSLGFMLQNDLKKVFSSKQLEVILARFNY